MNRGYRVAEFFPNLFFIGTDGGGEAYAFNISESGSGVTISSGWLNLVTPIAIVAAIWLLFIALRRLREKPATEAEDTLS